MGGEVNGNLHRLVTVNISNGALAVLYHYKESIAGGYRDIIRKQSISHFPAFDGKRKKRG